MASDPWDAFPAVGQQPAQAPPPASYPGVIQGRPKAVDPSEAERLRLAREAAARAAAAEDRAGRTEQRAIEKDALGTESERTAGFLADRLVSSLKQMGAVGQKDRDALAPTLGVEAVRGVLGDTAANYITDKDRQTIRANEIDILDAALTLGTGAAYTREQLEGYREAYFPQLGDGAETVRAKREKLLGLLKSAQIKAGRSSPDIEAAISAFSPLLQGGGTEKSDGPPDGVYWRDENGEPMLGEDGSPLGPDGGMSYSKDGEYLGLVGSTTYAGPNEWDQKVQTEKGRVDEFAGKADSSDLLKQGFMFGLADETAGVGTVISQALQGDFNASENYAMGRDVERARLDEARANSGWTGTGAELLGGLASGGVAMEGASLPMTGAQAFKQAALPGAVGGFGYGEGTAQSLGGAALGGVAAGGLGVGMNALAPKIAPMLNRKNTMAPEEAAAGREVVQAGARRGIPIRQADVRSELRPALAEARTTENGGQVIRNADQEDLVAFEAQMDKLGGGRTDQGRFGIGDATQSSLATKREATGEQGKALYTRAGRMAGDVKIEPRKALAKIDEQIAELRANGGESNRGLISYLEDIKSDLTANGPTKTGVLDAQGKMIERPPEGLSIDALRSQRTNMRGQISERNLTATDAERRVGLVLDDAAEDIKAGLVNNPRALEAFAKADDYWRTRSQFIKQIESKLVGPKDNPVSAETTAARLDNWMRGDFNRFRRLWVELPSENRADIAAKVAANLGRNGKGEFSLDFFLRQTNGKNAVISPKQARLVFGEEGMEALNDLRAIAQAKVDAAANTNRSGTGGVLRGPIKGLRTVLLSGLGFAGGDVTGAVVAPMAGNMLSKMGEERAARMLTNPDFTKWLKKLPETADPRAIDRAFEQLNNVAAKSPVFLADVRAMQEALKEAFTQSPSKLAADEPQGQNENNGRRVPPQ